MVTRLSIEYSKMISNNGLVNSKQIFRAIFANLDSGINYDTRDNWKELQIKIYKEHKIVQFCLQK